MANGNRDELGAKIAKEEFGSKLSEIKLVADGLIHQTYSLTAGRSKYILQISDRKDSREKALERKVHAFALAEKLDLPTPELITPINSFQNRKYYIAEKLPGKSLRENFDSKLASEIGGRLAEIHRIQDFEKAGHLKPKENSLEVSPFEEGNLKNHVIRQVKEDAERLEKNGFQQISTQINRFFDKHHEKLPSNFKPVLCHNDCSPDNILAEDREITGIIDFDYVYSGHNQRDLVKSANSFWLEGYYIREELYTGYQKRIT
ncbi:MAG: putative homoserine kinase type II [Candidatus Nanosalina sp. J07AB43]|nr:MAG: putative homoserine kinase type II [Candidatus Nanosalina sp. J07AB43]